MLFEKFQPNISTIPCCLKTRNCNLNQTGNKNQTQTTSHLLCFRNCQCLNPPIFTLGNF